ncbi:type I methionyl aminopeptidase [Eilatimonas milleporae]|uniref:Methionine aminopeptidase n=1 Tax=Eilatimonas milleporae TaxID=911205 RepID=A0A3M0CNN4_9PROT|nr:type I methionyl aminopeptidase [Eilatimonas milleporae]RMB04863.1 methionine aminopeptidase type I [Eilatimonas milleporae]
MNYVNALEAPEVRTGAIKVHGPEAFEGMRAAGRLAAQVLDYIAPFVVEGVSTGHLDTLCHDFIRDNGAVPAPLNYRGFPKSICTSVNHVICHGIPGEKTLKKGDTLNIDVTVILDGWYGDTSRMFFVGEPKILARRLCDVTFQAMWRGIEAVRPGAFLGDIGHAIQIFVEANRFSVVRDFCGHGIGRVFHDEPSVMHFGLPGRGPELKPGMFFTIEPMVNAGKPHSKILSDGWTAVTRDKSLSMQFEHTLAVTEDGYEVFTRSPKGWDHPPYPLDGTPDAAGRDTAGAPV